MYIFIIYMRRKQLKLRKAKCPVLLILECFVTLDTEASC